MANDGIPPQPPEQTPEGATPDLAIRSGSPGMPGDVVSASRITKRKPVEKPPEIKDPYREIVETVVFVVVLVFMLKTFLAEAFVIPTGSMATTLLGYHRDITCEKCLYEYRVNCSTEQEQGLRFERVVESDCPNCEYRNKVN